MGSGNYQHRLVRLHKRQGTVQPGESQGGLCAAMSSDRKSSCRDVVMLPAEQSGNRARKVVKIAAACA